MRPILLALATVFLLLIGTSGTADETGQLPEVSEVPTGPTEFEPGPPGAGSNRGAYSPVVPLETLPARRGLVPDLSLVYSHGRANGPLGAGWGLAFESAIERRSARRGVARFEEDDLFLVDGMPLVQIGDGTWRKEQDDRTVFEQLSGSAVKALGGVSGDAQIHGWRARRDGLTTIYGRATSGRLAGTEDTTILRRDEAAPVGAGEPTGWLISRIEDAFGNRIEFSYTVPEWGGFQTRPTGTVPLKLGADPSLVVESAPPASGKRTARATEPGRIAPPDATASAAAPAGATPAEALPGAKDPKTAPPVEPAPPGTLPGKTDPPAIQPGSTSQPGSPGKADGPAGLPTLLEGGAGKLGVAGSTHRHLPSQIVYNRLGEDRHVVDLGYVSRGDVRVSYADGSPRVEARLLAEILVSSRRAGETVQTHRYELEYATAANDEQSLLSAVIRHAVALDGAGSGGSFALRRFEYADRVFPGWGPAEEVTTTGADIFRTSGVDVDENLKAHSRLADVDGDARPDLLAFNEICSPQEMPELGTMLICSGADHRVFLNTPTLGRLGRPDGGWKLVHDPDRSAAMSAFLGPVHSHGTGERIDFAVVDLDRDGHADLVRGSGGGELFSDEQTHHNQVLFGGEDGWDLSDTHSASWLRSSVFESYRFADLDGDGYPDLVGQEQAYLNSGRFPFFDLDRPIEVLDPLASGGPYGPEDAGCVQSGDGRGAPDETLGTYTWGTDLYIYPDSQSREEITLDEWVWRNTVDADFNGDGLLDRLIAVPWLEEAPDDVWEIDLPRCGSHVRLYLGDGQGGFQDAGYGTGNLSAFYEVLTTHELQANSSGPLDDVTFTHRLHHLALADLDRSGRPEITQYCLDLPPANGWVSLKDRGLAGADPGYGVDGDLDCPGLSVAEPPLAFFGLTPLREVHASLLDLDGDGLPDGFIGPVHPGEGARMSSPGLDLDIDHQAPRWYPNQAGTAQNLLLEIEGPFGGATKLVWKTVTEGLPMAVEVISSIEDPQGKVIYGFGDGAYQENRFLGFRRAEVTDSTGAGVVRTYHGSVALEGKPITVQTYTAGGRLRHLKQFHYGWPVAPHMVLEAEATRAPDYVPPYLNPVSRECDFEFSAYNGWLDLDDYMAACDDFVEEPEGPALPGKVERQELSEVAIDKVPWQAERTFERDVWAVLRGEPPSRVTEDPERRLELEAVAATTRTAAARSTATSSGGGDPRRSAAAPASGAAPSASRATAGSQPRRATAPAGTPQPGKMVFDNPQPARPPDRLTPQELRPGGRDPLPETLVGEEGAQGTLPPHLVPQAQPAATPDYRFYVRETDHDPDTGRPTEMRDWRDVTTRADSTVSTLSYGAFDSELGGVLLLSSETRDRDGELFESYRYEDHAGTEWQRQVQLAGNEAGVGAAPSPAAQGPLGAVATPTLTIQGQRARTRTLDPATGVLLEETQWGEYAPVTYTYDACGQVERETDALGHWSQIERDAACRELRVSTLLGHQATFTHDGYGSLVRSVQSTPPSPDEVTEHDWIYGPAAVGSSPYHVEVRSLPGGAEALVRSFIDAHGRETRQESCLAAAAGERSCAAESEIVTVETEYDETTGEIASVSEPYGRGASAEDAATRFEYDEFRRKVLQVRPDGGEIRYAFGLGWQESFDPLEIDTRLEYDTLRRELSIGGIFRGAERYDAFGRRISSTDAGGSLTSYAYDGFNRLASRSDPAVEHLQSCAGDPDAAVAADRPVWRYGYSPADLLTSRTDPRGHTTRRSYDEIGRLLEVTAPDDAVVELHTYVDDPYPDRRESVADENGAVRTRWLDARDRVWRFEEVDGAVTRSEYDERGRPFRLTLPWGEVREEEYDFRDLAIRTIRRRGTAESVTELSYDAAGRLERRVDPDGELRRYCYDEMGRLTRAVLGDRGTDAEACAGGAALELESHVYDDDGRVTRSVVNGVATFRYYDELDRVVEELVGYEAGATPEGLVVTQRSWHELDLPATELNGEGQSRSYEYDDLGRLLRSELREADGSLTGSEEIAYDLAGNVTRRRDGRGLADCHDYDSRNRLLSSRPAGRGAIAFEHTAAAPHPVTGAPTLGRRLRTVAATGEVTTVWTDGLGRDWLVRSSDGTARLARFADGLLRSTTRIDSGGERHSVKLYRYEPGSDRLRLETAWLPPDAADRCAAAPATCEAPAVRTRRTPGDRLSEVRDAGGTVTSYSYRRSDASMLLEAVDYGGVTRVQHDYSPDHPVLVGTTLGPTSDPILTRLTRDRGLQIDSVVRRRTAGGQREEIGYRYDRAGRRSEASFRRDGAAENAYRQTWNARGQVTSRSHRLAGQTGSLNTGWSYELNGQLAAMTFPSGRRVTYAYDPGSLALDSVDLDTGETIARLGDRDASGRWRELELAVGSGTPVTVERRFRGDGLESQRRLTGLSRGPALVERFDYHPNGRLRSIEVEAEGASAPHRRHHFAYSVRDHLVGERHALRNRQARITHEYDDAGRRTARQIEGRARSRRTEFRYESGNRLGRVGATALAWDAYGRLERDQRGQSLAWGLAGQLREVRDAAGTALETLGHDADGQRVRRDAGGGFELFVPGPVSGTVVHRRSAGGGEDVVTLPDGTVVAILRSGSPGGVEVYPVLNDLRGSPYRVGAAGQSHRWVERTGFGTALGERGDLDSQLGFHGMWEDRGSGILTAGVRPYDPATGRFLAPDPLTYASAPEPNDAADFYRYAQNDPVGRRDPSGFQAAGGRPELGSRGRPVGGRGRFEQFPEPRFIEGAGGGPVSISGAPRTCQACGPTVAESIVARKIEEATQEFGEQVAAAVEEVADAVNEAGEVQIAADLTPEEVAQIAAFVAWAVANGFFDEQGATGRQATPEDIASLAATQARVERRLRRAARRAERRSRFRGYGRFSDIVVEDEAPDGGDSLGDAVASADEPDPADNEWSDDPNALPPEEQFPGGFRGRRINQATTEEAAREVAELGEGSGRRFSGPRVKGVGGWRVLHFGGMLGLGTIVGGGVSGGGYLELRCVVCLNPVSDYGGYFTTVAAEGLYASAGPEFEWGWHTASSFWGVSQGGGVALMGDLNFSWDANAAGLAVPLWGPTPVTGWTAGLGTGRGIGIYRFSTSTQ